MIQKLLADLGIDHLPTFLIPGKARTLPQKMQVINYLAIFVWVSGMQGIRLYGL